MLLSPVLEARRRSAAPAILPEPSPSLPGSSSGGPQSAQPVTLMNSAGAGQLWNSA